MKPLLLLTLLTFQHMTQASTSITIYSGKHQGHLNPNQLKNAYNIPGFAVIKQSRTVPFEKGQFTLAFDDVAEFIDPTTVSFSTPDNPNAAVVLDQNFQFDLVGTDKLLQKYLDQTITVNHSQGDQSLSTTGTLLSTQGGITLKNTDGIITINQWNHIQFPELPGGLLTKPTLVWLLDSTSGKEELISMSYQTQGMTWWTDYNVTLADDSDRCRLDLSSWVSIVNKSGASFQNSQLKLIAGDVNRTQAAAQPKQFVRESLVQASAQDFTEQELFEYHLYKLPRPINLPNNSTKQIQLLKHTNDIVCERTLLFNGSGHRHYNYHRPITDTNYLRHADAKVEAYLSFKNSKENQLGIALPAGRVRVNMIDQSDGSVEFIGEDSIDHTTKNEMIELKLGHAFDVKGKRIQKHFELINNGLTEQFEITINNQKDKRQKIKVIEPLYRWSNWRITQHNEDYQKLDAATISFEIEVPAESQKTIQYTVQYQWPNNKK